MFRIGIGAHNGDEVSLMSINKVKQAPEDAKIFPELPEWLHQIAPTAEGEEALLLASAWSQYHEELSQRVRRFVDSALRGVACRVAEVAGLENGVLRKRHFWLADLRNLLVCADSELARRTHKTLSPYEPRLHLYLEAREEFLDCLGVLIAAHRQRQETMAEQLPVWLPQPEAAGLRPPNFSLRSGHLSGALAAWLGSCAPVPPLQPPEVSAAPPRRRHSEDAAIGAKASAKSRIRTRSQSVYTAWPGRSSEEEALEWPVPSKE
ncbi:hypothetical protein AK812_SmicGene12165 [Symbiodinium microadriaticum]|uniref:Uncharacterized protein n=1 Tax=Symbiodinium microadriaticum TaxID=2951 RepID=A0A1Q9EBE2_SYMMI|nr:hypothetical protein AK812_SmicGene12165 [Symbiodinium microadriaticum]